LTNQNVETSNCFFSNNIIEATNTFWPYDFGFTSSVFKNNIFLRENNCGYDCLSGIKATGSTFENNIFISTSWACRLISNSAINNNLFVESEPLSQSSNWGSNNIVNQPQSSIFINQSGNIFNYTHDYHLQSSSPGKDAGKDGTDIGFYGGAFPWKAGSVPPNPHIQFENVAGGVDEAGNLHVTIKVAAQDR
jgi:hypothetical protein